MTRQRTFSLVAAGLLGAAALSACGSEDARTVGGVAVDGLAAASGSSGAAGAPAATSTAASTATTSAGTPAAVAPLQTVQGVLQREADDDDDAQDPADRYDDFTVNGIEVDFGPSEWVIAAPALQDYDGDGTAEPLATELDALVGQQVTLQVRDDDGDDDGDDDRAGDHVDDADVYEVNGLALRDLTGPAPWRGGPAPTGALVG